MLLEFTAIQEMIKRGCLWYHIGNRPFVGDKFTPNEKEIAIGYFKEGFATHVFASSLLTIPVKD